MADDFDLESLAHLEQTFYDAGYEDGFAHGRIHGLIEGRALGREKGFEMWEELGFYEGFASTWQTIYTKQGRTNERAAHHIKHLLDLIKQFPTVNPPVSDDSDLDIPKLFGQIRSRYKALCSTLGVRSDLRAANETSPLREQADEMDALETGHQDNTVWKLDGQPKKPAVGSLDF